MSPDTTTPAESTSATLFGSRGLGISLLITGLVAMVGAMVLFFERVALWLDPNHITSCDISPWVSCGTVMNSWQASAFGFPNILMGVIGFTVIITTGASMLAGARYHRWFGIAFSLGTLFAMLFCLWLWTQAVYSINALCLYCMVVWTAVIPMCMLVIRHNSITGVFRMSDKSVSWVKTLTWPIVVLLYAIITLSIVLHFGFSAA